MSRSMIRFAVTIAVACVYTAPVSAATLKVPADFPTIQEAVDAALPADVIVVSSGIYEENIAIPTGRDGITLRGKGNVILDARPGGVAGGPGISVGSPLVTIRNLTIRHAETATMPGSGIIGTQTGLRVIGCVILNSEAPAISATNTDVEVDDCRIIGAAGGVVITGAGGSVTDTRIENVSGDGIRITGAGSRVRDCFVAVVDGDGIRVDGNDSVVEKNKVRNADGDGLVVSGTGLTLSDNRVENVTGAAVTVTGAGAIVDAAKVDGCNSGITVNGADAKIRDCVVTSSAGRGIQVAGAGAEVTRARIENTRSFAVDITGDDAQVEDGDFKSTSSGVRVVGQTPLIAGNKIVRCSSGAGVAVQNSTTGGTIANNTIRDTFGAALAFTQCSFMQVFSNTIRACGVTGPSVTISGDGFLFAQNVVRDGPGDGVLVSGDNCGINGNTVRDNLIDGIEVTGTGNSLNGNKVTGNGGEGIQNSGSDTDLLNNSGSGNRIDFASDGTINNFFDNTFKTGGEGTLPEID